jgi:hypothetical protein
MVPVINPETNEPFLDDKGDPKTKLETPEQWARRAIRLYAARGMHAAAVHRGDDNPQLETALREATDIIESEHDLCLLFNSRDTNALPKFERVLGDGAGSAVVPPGQLYQLPGESLDDFLKRVQEEARRLSPAAEAAKEGFDTHKTDVGRYPKPVDYEDTYDEMTVDELKAHAASEEIPLGSAKSKKDIIAILRQHVPAG